MSSFAKNLEAASAATIMAAVDAGNRAFWLEREVALGQAQQAAHRLAQPPRLAAWQADLREAAARLRLFPWYFTDGFTDESRPFYLDPGDES